jgi:hypothetical protein
MHDDKNKIPDEQLFPETSDWSAMAEELAQQLNVDARHLVKKYPAPNVGDLAVQITAKISSEQNSASQPVSLHVVNDEMNDDRATDFVSTREEHGVVNVKSGLAIDRTESLEWLKITAAAMLFLAVTASAIWYSSRLTENVTSPITVANENIRSVPQVPVAASQSSPRIATVKINDQQPVAVLPFRGTVRTEEIPFQRNSHIGEVSFDAKPQSPAPKRKVASEAEMLRSQLLAFEQVIQSMQREIENLRRETSQLQKQISEQKQSVNAK